MPETPARNTNDDAPRDDVVDHHGEVPVKIKEYGGPPGKEPTRYGDWEKNGRCIDF
ncbi:MAG: DUF1674 domain-containing protein [Gammaproteobacteria bacterium]|nr:DUF1674 domain-containing protein [Gammaproteobacteria bacterium]